MKNKIINKLALGIKKLRAKEVIIALALIGISLNTYAQVIGPDSNLRIGVKVSKKGLNRISNPPYKITQVTGDDNSFKLKYDEDGQNIYLMPVRNVGEKIEISIKNNAGHVQDLELEVANIKGQTIIIDGDGKHSAKSKSVVLEKKKNIEHMLKAMSEGIEDKFYVQDISKPYISEPVIGSNDLEIVQTKIYRWQNLAGSVFTIKNRTKYFRIFDLDVFSKSFSNILTTFVENKDLGLKGSTRLFIVQEIKE